MIEFNAMISADAYRVLAAERDLRARNLARNAELRRLMAEERAGARERTVIVNKPSHLAGLHKL